MSGFDADSGAKSTHDHETRPRWLSTIGIAGYISVVSIDRPRDGDRRPSGDGRRAPQGLGSEEFDAIVDRARAESVPAAVPSHDRDDSSRADLSNKRSRIERLPDVDNVKIDRGKFINFSMDPNHTGNQGKWKAWPMIGYDVRTRREESADDVIGQIHSSLKDAEAAPSTKSEYGQRFETNHQIIGPNGRRGTVVAVWQADSGTVTPRMLTNWLKVHEEGRDRESHG